MDPVSAVSVAAASLHFASAVLGCIKILIGLKDAPARLIQLLRDVDKSVVRIAHLQQMLQDPASELVQKLNPIQLDTLRAAVDDGYQSVLRFQGSVQPILGDQNGKTQAMTKRIWRSLISVKFERQLEEKLERIRWNDNEILRSLQACGLDLQAQTS
jgi:hypothetical protein